MSLPPLSSALLAVLLTSMCVGQDTVGDTSCSSTLIFASDTQEPMRVEEILLHSDQNQRATRALFRDMLAQRPTELFLLGDVVNLGYQQKRWTFIDSALALARERGFNVNAVLGNHELMGRAGRGEANFQTRFPGHVRTGYVVQRDSMAVVLLNSNFNKLTRADQALQQAWYLRTLVALDSAQDVRVVIVCCHHSPYSESKMVGSSSAVQQRFVAPFLAARKTGVFISGHAHLFEHFRKSGKEFFVIGGGGGLHHPLRKHPGPEVCLEPEYDPMFHYLTLQLCQGSLRIVSRRLDDAFNTFDDGCDFEVTVPR